MMVWIIALRSATSVSGLNCSMRQAWRESHRGAGPRTRGHAVPRRVLHPGGRHRVVRSRVGADEEDELGVRHIVRLVGHRFSPMPSSSAATEEAWHRRVQWSTLLVPNPVRTSFSKR